jgi:hypothetical protein
MSERQGHLKTPAPYSDKGDCTNCGNCITAKGPCASSSDRVPDASKTIAKPSAGGEFERVMCDETYINPACYDQRQINGVIERLTAAHNVDIAQARHEERERVLGECLQYTDRIAELEAQVPQVVVPVESKALSGFMECPECDKVVKFGNHSCVCGVTLDWQGK